MKVVFGTVLGLALAVSPLLARQEPDKPKQEEPKQEPKQEPKPEPKQQPEDKGKPNTEKPQPDAGKQQKQDEKQQQKSVEKQNKDAEKQQSKDADKKPKDNHAQPQPNNIQQTNRGQQSAQQAPGHGERIPPQRFQASFGRDHHFHVGRLDDRRRFQYGGYWFEVNQGWPTGWSHDDDCYIEDDDGTYYLVDVVHPGVRVLVVVVEA
jgi:hypothetical protein